MLELLRQRRWLGFTLFAAVMVGLCVVLANWQWQRYQLRQDQNAQLDAALAAPAAPISQVLTPSAADAPVQPLPADLAWRSVSAVGQFDVAGQVAVRRRPLDGRNGFWIVTPLRTPDGVVLVNRGWVGADGSDARATPTVPAPPVGQVSVTGRLRPTEPAHEAGEIPAGQAWSVDPLVLAAGQPRYDAYLDLTAAQPPAAEGLTALPTPGHRGTNNLVYAVQWVIFGLVALFGWWRLLAAESQKQVQHDAQPVAGGPEAGLS